MDLVHARISCRDYLRAEIVRHEGIFGLLFMRQDGSLFGTLPEGNFFLDDPKDNPLSEDIKTQILNAPRGQTVWVGPVSGASLYGFENDNTPKNIMIAAWKYVDVSYGECYVLVMMDESIFEKLFDATEDGKSTWHLFTADQTEIYQTGQDVCPNPGQLISESNSGTVFLNEKGNPISSFSMTIKSPEWTLVREVFMGNYEQVIRRVRSSVFFIAAVVFLIAPALCRLWLRKFLLQFNTLLKGIIRMGEGQLDPVSPAPFTIGEFETMHQEIDRTSRALNEQMDTIRRMEREKAEHENMIRQQEQIVKELRTARQIQKSVLPHIFPPFPDRKEIDLFASMDPAKDVGGDFYDFYFIDEDHLCLVIADVSGKPCFYVQGDNDTNLLFGGMNFIYDMSKPAGERVRIEGFSNGRAFDEDAVYLVAVNNYILGNGHCGLRDYSEKDAVWSQTDENSGETIQNLIEEYIRKRCAADGALTTDAFSWHWSIDYLAEPNEPAPHDSEAAATFADAPEDGHTYILYHEGEGRTLTDRKVSKGFDSAACQACGNDLTAPLPENALRLTAHITDPDKLKLSFTDPQGRYLTCGTGGRLILTMIWLTMI